jgi:predicted RecB family nuclease
MRIAADGTLRLSPTDLANHLACAHLTQLAIAVQREELIKPHRENPHADLIRRKGDEHEAAFLARLFADGRDITEIELGEDGFEEAALATEEALRAGVEVVYQGVLASENWRGIADSLTRIDEPSALGSFSYEAWDTKLARSAKPNAVLQLTFYSHELERSRGAGPSGCTSSSARQGGDVPAPRLRCLPRAASACLCSSEPITKAPDHSAVVRCEVLADTLC